MLAVFCFGVFAQEQPQSSRLKAIYLRGKWGYADQTGKVVIAPQFDAARPFNNGLAQVGVLDEKLPEINSRPNLKWGLIDENGRVLLELRYTQIRPFTEGLAAVAVLDPDKLKAPKSRLELFSNLQWGYIDRQGRIAIPLQFAGAGNFSEGLASVNVDSGSDSFCGRGHKAGYIDTTGKFVIQPQFASTAPFKNGRAEVSLGVVRYLGRCACCAPKFFGKYGHIDKSGVFTLDPTRPDTSNEIHGWEN